MSNLSYWERRQIEDMYRYMQSAEDCADQISKFYRKASRYLSLQADGIFERFQTKHKLSDAEARALLNVIQDRTSLDELMRQLKNTKNTPEKQELIQKLEAPAYQARLERLRQLQNQIDYVMKNVYQQERDFSTSHYIDLANEAYYRSIYRLQQRVGAAFSFGHVSAKQIDKAVGSRWSGRNYSERIWRNTRLLAQSLKEELLVNLVTGRTERETAEIIANKFGQGAFNARRLVRTESNYISGEMNFQAYDEAGIDEYMFMATLDLRTSKICRGLDGKIFKTKDRKVGVNCHPMHPWCRSTTIAVISREWLKKQTRKARNPVTGKTIDVPMTMNYQQWYDKYVKGKPEAELEEKKIKNRSSDRTQHKKYREILGENVPEKLDDFQKMKYNEEEKWRKAKQLYRDTNAYNKIIEKAGELNIKGKPVKNIERVDLSEYSFNAKHINLERMHGVMREEAQEYVKSSVAAFSRWNGDVTVYISKIGAAVVNHRNKIVSTAYRTEEYDDKFNRLLEVLGIDKVSDHKQGD